MSKRATILFALLFAGSLIFRDVAFGLFFNPLTTSIFAELHNEKETSEKGGKEGAKEMDEFRIPFIVLHLKDTLLSASSLIRTHSFFYPSVITEVQGQPPEII